MKCQNLFSEKNKNNLSEYLLKFETSKLSIKSGFPCNGTTDEFLWHFCLSTTEKNILL